jgi:hypothetical protein
MGQLSVRVCLVFAGEIQPMRPDSLSLIDPSHPIHLRQFEPREG